MIVMKNISNMILISYDKNIIRVYKLFYMLLSKEHKKRTNDYLTSGLFAFSAALPTHIVAMTAIIVTTTAYTNMAVIVLASPNTWLKIAFMLSFHAKAATSPNAAVINAASFSMISLFIFIPPFI